jgi:lipopolysaccharide export system protein LptA
MRRNSPLAPLALASVLALMAHGAHAERADRDKPVNIESDRMTADDAKKTATFEGGVVLTQGTLTIRADRIVVRQDESGFQYGVAYGTPAKFRQKREGTEEFVDGEALRLEYDGRGDDVRGSYISYDAKTEYFTVNSGRQAAKSGRDSRVRATIMPKKSEPAKPAEPLGLKPAPSIPKP